MVLSRFAATVTIMLAAALAVCAAPTLVAAQAFSNCHAIARALPGSLLVPVSTASPAASDYEVSITYVSHSTFRITAPDATTIATDYAGYAGRGPRPDVVTMNHAHTSHWTPYPDPEIPVVLPGWNPDGGGPAEHFITQGEVLIRNVPSDIRSYGGVEENGNSIFIFEMAGLCIGHLGHLHQELSDAQVAEIGRLDVVFVPIDGSATMNHGAMMNVVERLRASIAIPMHWFSNFTLTNFVAQTRDYGLAIEVKADPVLKVSLNTLPRMPTLVVLPRERGF